IGLDERAARNLVASIDEQAEATGGAVPDDRTIVVERFRDELGDWRVCILSPFGSRVHAPWALAIEARVQDRLGSGAQVLWSDDGIVLRLPEAVERIPIEDLVFKPDEIEETVVDVLPSSAMFLTVLRAVAALSLDRDLLRELIGTDELRVLLDAGALDEVELSLQGLGDGRRARHADAVHDLLRELGPLREGELAARTEGDASALLATLVDE